MTTIAAPPTPPPLTPGRRSAIRILLITAATVLILGTVGTLGTAAWGLSTFRVVTDSKTLPTAMRSLVVDTGRVPAAVRITTDRGAVEPRADMRMVNSTRASSHPLAVSIDGPAARVSVTGESSPYLRWGRAAEITIVLPPELARGLSVTSQQENGVLMAQADLDQLIARTTHGALLLSGAARRMELHSVNGDVISRSPISVSESFSATTVDGDIEVDFTAAAPRTVEASTNDGDVRIGLPGSGSYAVTANTGRQSGSTVVRVPQTTDRSRAASVITARSETGDVVVDDLR